MRMARMLIICIRLLTPKRLIKLEIRWLPSYLDFGQSGIPGNKVDTDKAKAVVLLPHRLK